MYCLLRVENCSLRSASFKYALINEMMHLSFSVFFFLNQRKGTWTHFCKSKKAKKKLLIADQRSLLLRTRREKGERNNYLIIKDFYASEIKTGFDDARIARTIPKIVHNLHVEIKMKCTRA